jgi:cytochrome b561
MLPKGQGLLAFVLGSQLNCRPGAVRAGQLWIGFSPQAGIGTQRIGAYAEAAVCGVFVPLRASSSNRTAGVSPANASPRRAAAIGPVRNLLEVASAPFVVTPCAEAGFSSRRRRKMTKTRYTLLQRLLHWLIALVVFAMLAIGLTFMTVGGYEGTVETFGDAMTNNLYTYHKSFGVLLLILMVLRVALRRLNPAPPYNPPIQGYERAIGGGVHILLYVLLIGIPIGGWLATAAGGYPVQFFAFELPGFIGKNEQLSETLFLFHGYAGLLLLGLIVLHVAAAVKHWRRKDNVMQRISLP